MKHIPATKYYFPIIVFSLIIFGLRSAQAQNTPEENRWLNWVDYISHHPDYRQHQEPQDIAAKGAKWGTWVTFPNKIAAIAAKVKNWDNPQALFNSLDFLAIYKHPGHYYDHCLAYLSDPKQPEAYKKIVIYAMEQRGHMLAYDCYKLYQKQQLSEELFRASLGDFDLLHIHPLVTQEGYSDFDKGRLTNFLQQVGIKAGTQTPIGVHIDSILSGKLAKKWKENPSHLLHYRNKLPIAPTIHQAAEDYRQYTEHRQWIGDWKNKDEKELATLRGQQQYLMLLEHINEYMFLGSEDGDDQFFSFLKDPHTTNEEKQVFLFAMYRIGGIGKAKNTVHTLNRGIANLLDRTYWYYRTGHLALPLLEGLLYAPLSLLNMGAAEYPRYPFFVTSYKSIHIQEGLDPFISSPTIPCGWKDLAKRLKKGSLLTRKEMKYLKGYQEFLATHFILYENIPSQK